MNRRKFLLGVLRGVLAAAAAPLVSILPGVRGARAFPFEFATDQCYSVTMRQIIRAKQILDDQDVTASRYVLLTNEQITELFGPMPAAPPWTSWSWKKLAEVNPRIEGFEIIAVARGTGTVAAWAGGHTVFIDGAGLNRGAGYHGFDPRDAEVDRWIADEDGDLDDA